MAAPTEIYVDPAINANSGSGTIGDPYGDLQYALSNYAWNTSNGNRINVKSGTAEIVTGQLIDPNMFLSDAAPVYIEGYTSVAGDGGYCELDGNNGSYSPFQYTNRMGLRRIKIHNFSGSLGLGGFSYLSPNHYVDLEVYDCNSVLLTSGVLRRCWVHDMRSSTSVISAANSNATILDCFLSDCQLTTYGIYLSSAGRIIGTIIHESGSSFGILTQSYASSILSDVSIHSPSLGFTNAIRAVSGNYNPRGGNVLVEGSGSGNVYDDTSASAEMTLEHISAFGVSSIYGGFADIAPGVSATHELLTESPFQKIGTLPTDFTAVDFWSRVHDYFRPKAVGDVIRAGYRTRGAVPPSASGGSSRRHAPFSGGISG